MRIGLTVLPEHRRDEATRIWRAVEELGFDSGWTFDHLGWRTLVDGPWYGAVPTLSLAALVTERIEIGPFVVSPNVRSPVPFARDVLALDELSRGRFTAALGAGTPRGYDTEVLGLPRPASRLARFEEFTVLLDRLLTEERVTHHGEYYTAVEARSAPGCVQRPRVPFVLAADGPRTVDLAARLGEGWVTTGSAHDDLEPWWRGLADLCAAYDEARARAGHDPSSGRRILDSDGAPVYALSSAGLFDDVVGRAGELGFTDVVAAWPRREGVFAGDEDVLTRVSVPSSPSRTSSGR
ncbi:LLM class flavin-dependent oxidoreductase [Actinomycetospora chiangmaiensis]|uniref:LLM class flavin-dependent oxidoreductase n=1 Tax=Actinomycetospora chiangmaiensis TaxID=402650 RepID=UPI000373A0B3|nr:LLM class flavin-dependent oxidoreductase [Actinomycetospora chiangmaiensis]